MPVKNETPEAVLAEIREKFLEHCGELFDSKTENIFADLKANEEKVANFGLKVSLDFSGTAATMETKISGGGLRWKDSRTATFEDPNQPSLPMEETNRLNNGHGGVNGNGHHEAEGEEAESEHGRPKKGRGKSRAAA